MTCSWLLPLTLSLALASSSCSSGGVDASLVTGGISSGAGHFAVSGGGIFVKTGQPVLIYGSVVENDRRAYTYLVITRSVNWKKSRFEETHRGTAISNGDHLSTDHTLRVQDTRLVASYSATVADGRLQDRELKLGASVVPAGEWLFLHDATDPGAGFVPVTVDMPELPAEFEELEAFTLQYADELMATDETVRAFVAGGAR